MMVQVSKLLCMKSFNNLCLQEMGQNFYQVLFMTSTKLDQSLLVIFLYIYKSNINFNVCITQMFVKIRDDNLHRDKIKS